MPAPALRVTPGGILVPSDLERPQQVWAWDDKRLLDRVARLLDRGGVSPLMRCKDPDCHGVPLERITHADGSIVLRCPHLDRVFRRAL